MFIIFHYGAVTQVSNKLTCLKQFFREFPNKRSHLPYGFGKALQRVDDLFITFAKGKILDRRKKSNILTLK